MTKSPTNGSEHDAINKVVQMYLDGAKSGKGDDMKPAFHKDATVFGYVGPDLFAGPIQQLFAWNDGNGPATELQSRIASIDLVGTVATVRLELDNWTGPDTRSDAHCATIFGDWEEPSGESRLKRDRPVGRRQRGPRRGDALLTDGDDNA